MCNIPMNKTRPLQSLSQILSGLPSGKLYKSKADNSLDARLINADAITHTETLNEEKIKKVWIDEATPKKFFLRDKDIIVTLRGSRFKSTIFHCKKTQNLFTTSSNNAIIRCDQNIIAPEILNFFLNTDWFRASVIYKTQSNLVLINLKALKNLDIPVPGLGQQSRLIKQYYCAQELQKATLDLITAQNSAIETKFLAQYLQQADNLPSLNERDS